MIEQWVVEAVVVMAMAGVLVWIIIEAIDFFKD